MTENGNTQPALEYAKGRGAGAEAGTSEIAIKQRRPPYSSRQSQLAITNKLFTVRPYGDILSLFPSNLLIHARGIARF